MRGNKRLVKAEETNMIFIVEDDKNIRELLEYSLNNSGFEARGFERPSDFRAEMRKIRPELVLMDIMLPEEDGMHILRSMRESREYADIPVIMLTAKGSEYDKIMGLDGGADDYVTKPFSIMELISRIKAVLRRAEKDKPAKSAKEFTAGTLYLNYDSHVVKADGQEVSLTFKEFELLYMLFCNRNIVLDRDRILKTIWEYDFDGETRTVDVHVRSLRSKLGESGNCIKTVRGMGYKLEV